MSAIQTLFDRARAILHSVWAYLRAQPPLKLFLVGLGLPLLLIAGVFAFLFIGVLNGDYGPLPAREELARIQNAEASSVISEDGELLGKYFAENRVSIAVEDISPYVTQALVATEDARFFEHQGIDLRALARVAFRTVLLGDRSSGGGSTISQQLAKHLYPRQRYGRLGILKMKLREMVIASRIEDVYSKPELLALYLNTVPFGENAFGIEVASQRFFSKSASKLRAEEAAVLVGLLKATTAYSPRAHPERSRERRNTVLSRMATAGDLTTALADSLRTLPLKIDYQRANARIGAATYFRQHLRGEAERILAEYTHEDGRPYDLDRDGLRLHVSVNSQLQRMAEEAVAEQLPRVQASFDRDWAGRRQTPWSRAFDSYVSRQPNADHLRNGAAQAMTIYDGLRGAAVDTIMTPLDSLRHYFTLFNAGLLATDARNGVVRAWVGGVDYRYVQFDHVRSKRQVGSTIKPVVYAAALEKGMLPCEYTPAERFTLEDFRDYNPSNPNGEYEGAYSMRGGLAKSVNTVAVNIAVRTGLPEVVGQIHAMGVSGEIEQIPSVALGTVEASLVEMNLVYSSFAGGGLRPGVIHYLDRIEDAAGNIIVEIPRPRARARVLSDSTAIIANYLLEGVVNGGTGVRLRSRYGLRGRIGGKTGTTQHQSDGWFMGYTPRLVVGVWVGAEYPSVHFRTLSRGSATATALPIWGTFLRKLQAAPGLGHLKKGSLPRPDEMTLALLECPDYLEEMPIYRDSTLFDPGDDIADRLREFLPGEIEEAMGKKRRRNSETPTEYAERIVRELERDRRRDERREKRKEFWSKTLFGKKN